MKISAVIVLLILFLLSLARPGAGLWALEHLRDRGWILGLMAGLLLVLPLLGRFLARWKEARGESILFDFNRFGRPATWIQSPWISGILAFAAFSMILLLPAHRYDLPPHGLGDGLYLMEALPVYAETVGGHATVDEILEPFLRTQIYLASGPFGSVLTAPVRQTAMILGAYSVICGLLQIGAIFLFLRKRSVREQVAGWLLLFFVPGSQVFAFYVEHYSFAAFAVTGTLLLVWTDLEGDRSRPTYPFLVGTLSALGVLHHLIAGFLLPALILYAWVRGNRRIGPFLRTAAIAGCGALIVLLPGFAAFWHFSPEGALSLGHIAHPPLLRPDKLFSSWNTSRLIQILLLAAPVSIAFMLQALAARFLFRLRTQDEDAAKSQTARDVSSILITTAISYLMQAWVWNATIGLPADWDLFSFAAWPLHLWALHRILRPKSALSPLDGLSWPGIAAIAALTLLPALLWMTWNHTPAPETEARLLNARRDARNTIQALGSEPLWMSLSSKQRQIALPVQMVGNKLIDRGASLRGATDRERELRGLLHSHLETILSGDHIEEGRILARMEGLHKEISTELDRTLH